MDAELMRGIDSAVPTCTYDQVRAHAPFLGYFHVMVESYPIKH